MKAENKSEINPRKKVLTNVPVSFFFINSVLNYTHSFTHSNFFFLVLFPPPSTTSIIFTTLVQQTTSQATTITASNNNKTHHEFIINLYIRIRNPLKMCEAKTRREFNSFDRETRNKKGQQACRTKQKKIVSSFFSFHCVLLSCCSFVIRHGMWKSSAKREPKAKWVSAKWT